MNVYNTFFKKKKKMKLLLFIKGRVQRKDEYLY